MRVQLLLEITAGQGSCLGCRFEEIEAILGKARGGDTFGVCFDTCHAHTAGYDLSTEEGYDRTFDAFARVLGLDRLKAFHLNDSKTPTGSRVDRHAEIGDGYLGLLPFWRLVNDPRFATTPGVLETPSGPDKLPSFARNLARLRALIGAPRPPGPAEVASPAEGRGPAPGTSVRVNGVPAAPAARAVHQVNDDDEVEQQQDDAPDPQVPGERVDLERDQARGRRDDQPFAPGVAAPQRVGLDAAEGGVAEQRAGREDDAVVRVRELEEDVDEDVAPRVYRVVPQVVGDPRQRGGQTVVPPIKKDQAGGGLQHSLG